MAGFAFTGSLQTPRGAFAATRLDDGRVLVAGGLGADGSGVLETEVYDQATGQWTGAGALHGVHVRPQLVATLDGAAVIGGDPAGGDVRLETWNASTTTWQSHLVDPYLAAADGARFSTDHLDVVCGARAPRDPLGTGRFVRVSLSDGSVARMPTPGYDRAHAFVVALADGSILACSGSGAAIGASGGLVEYLARTSELFEPAEGTWRPLGRLAVPHVSLDRAGECLAVLDVDALMVGGSDQADRYTDVVEHFSASTGRWTRRAPLPDRRDLHTTTRLDSTTVLVIGGEGDTGVRADGYTYDVTADEWSPLDAMNRPRLGHAAVVLPDNSVLVIGGTDDGSCELLT